MITTVRPPGRPVNHPPSRSGTSASRRVLCPWAGGGPGTGAGAKGGRSAQARQPASLARPARQIPCRPASSSRWSPCSPPPPSPLGERWHPPPTAARPNLAATVPWPERYQIPPAPSRARDQARGRCCRGGGPTAGLQLGCLAGGNYFGGSPANTFDCGGPVRKGSGGKIHFPFTFRMEVRFGALFCPFCRNSNASDFGANPCISGFYAGGGDGIRTHE